MKRHRILACCRVGASEAALFLYWLEHYGSHVDTLVALCVHRPGEDVSVLREIARTRPRLTLAFLEMPHFEDGRSMTRLHVLVQDAGRHDWVLHADVDEFVEMENLQTLLDTELRNGALWIKGWLVDRFAPGGVLPALDPRLPLARQFPVWTSVTQLLCEDMAHKCILCVWPEIGRIHQFSGDERNHRCGSRPVLVHHYKWHGDVLDRTRRWIADYAATGKPWDRPRRLLLEHCESRGGRVAVENYVWRNWVHGWFDYAPWYEQLAREVPEGGILVEAGVWQGASLIHLAQACRAAGRKIHLYGVDLFADAGYLGDAVPSWLSRITEDGSWLHLVVENLREHRVLDDVKLLQLPIARAARCFDDDGVFACYVDGAHDYASVLEDIRAWWPKIAPGGYLSGHDWDQDPVKQAVRDLASQAQLSVRTHGPSVWILQKPFPIFKSPA